MGIRDSTRAERAGKWLKSHGSAERSLGRALRVYFADQGERVVDAIRENFPGALPSPDQLPLIFRADAEHARLMPIVRRNLGQIMLIGARAEQRAARHLTGFKAADDALDLPEITRQAIRTALDELEQQDYWRNIQSETEKNLREIIEQAIDDKLGNYQLGMLIREHLGGMPANKRAQKIARTETTASLNAGHAAYDESLVENGILTAKEWSSIVDDSCRETHAALDGVKVPARANFIVGSSPAPFRGHWSLPGKERINCRCVSISVLADEFMPDAVEEPSLVTP